MSTIVGRGGSITGRATKVAAVRNFNYRKAGMLFMVGAQSAIIRTTIMGFGVKGLGVFGSLVVITYILVIGNIIGNDYLRFSMLPAIFEHIYLFILKDNLGIYPP
jgi:hypothetical protein|tara:strand:+ start:1394 stop:1708 length:315 start_codon:yes stop_codon:yes gene_type:complete